MSQTLWYGSFDTGGMFLRQLEFSNDGKDAENLVMAYLKGDCDRLVFVFFLFFFFYWGFIHSPFLVHYSRNRK